MRFGIEIALSLVLVLGPAMVARGDIKLLRDTIIDPHGLVMPAKAPYGRNINGLSFVGDALVSFNGYQYSAFWAQSPADGKTGHVAVARRKLPDGKWRVIDLVHSQMRNGLNRKTHLPWDAHNIVSIGLCTGDGSLHISYDLHNHTLRYRRTAPGVATHPESMHWSAKLFDLETAVLVPSMGPIHTVCYPYFIDMPDGSMQLTFRRGQSGDGSWWLFNYDPASHSWTSGWQYDNGHVGIYHTNRGPSGQRCAYPNAWTYGPDGKLHITFTYRENFGPHRYGNGSNHDIDYVYSPDRGKSWYNNAGTLISDRDSTSASVPKLFTVNSPGLVIERFPQTDSLMNTQAQAVDSKGRIHTVMWHLDPAKADPSDHRTWQPDHSSYFHYWRDADGKWESSKIPGAVGIRPKLVFDRNDTAYVVYTLPTGPDAHTKNIYYAQGRLVIATAKAADHWTHWTIHDVAPGPFGTEPLLDARMLHDQGILSIFMQDSPGVGDEPTAVRTLDFSTK